MIVVMGGMLFFMTRSQKKQQNQRQEVLNNMKIGDKVITIGGLHGYIDEINVDKGTVILDCEGIFLEFNRAAVSTVKPEDNIAKTETVTPVEEVETVEVIEETPEVIEEVVEETIVTDNEEVK